MTKRVPLTYKGEVVGAASVNEDGTIIADIDPDCLSEDAKQALCFDVQYLSIGTEVA